MVIIIGGVTIGLRLESFSTNGYRNPSIVLMTISYDGEPMGVWTPAHMCLFVHLVRVKSKSRQAIAARRNFATLILDT